MKVVNWMSDLISGKEFAKDTNVLAKDLISKQDAIEIIKNRIEKSEVGESVDHDKVIADITSFPSAQPFVLTCDGCKYVGTYDTDFPCSGCIRREKDCYEQER